MVDNISNKDFSMTLILCTVVLTAYSQLIVKWRVSLAGPLPLDLAKKTVFLVGLLFDPWIMSAILGAFFAGLAWMAAMTKLDLSYAYPFMSLAFVLVLICSALFFHEVISGPKVVGLLLIILGIIVTSRG